MASYTWFEGEKSFVAPGAKPRHGDPALTLAFDRPAQLPWHERLWLCIEVEVDQFSDATVIARCIGKTPEEYIDLGYQILPNLPVTFRVRLDECWSKRHFLPVFPGAFKGHCNGLPLDPARVERIEVQVRPGKDF